MSPSPTDMSPLKQKRRSRILDAAEQLFRQFGYRATTMEAVAAEVGMSKVTVYGYFKDKGSLFEAVAHRVADRMRGSVRNALAGEGLLHRRLIDALVSKHEVVFEVVRGSAFSGELFAAKDHFATVMFGELDREIEEMIVAALSASGMAANEAAATGRVVCGASIGIGNRARDRAEMAADIETLVRALAGQSI